MITFQQLLFNLNRARKFPGTKQIDPAPLINEGYPSNFNLSFAYYEWTKKEGQTGPNRQYISFASDMLYTKVQPCFRANDWKLICENNGGENYKYLSFFHMADVSGLIAKENHEDQKKIGDFAIESLLDFFKESGIDMRRIFVSYCSGGPVATLTSGKYSFPQSVSQDPFTTTWVNNGLPAVNLLPDNTRDTLLALRNYSRPSPWGYRNEIYYKTSENKLLDIATVEHLCFEPIFDNQMNITEITSYKHAFSISAVGTERLLMALNNLNDIREVNIIKPLYQLVEEERRDISFIDTDILIQTLRPLQAIISGGGKWSVLNSRRKDILRALYIQLGEVLAKNRIKISGDMCRKIFTLNAELLNDQTMLALTDEALMEIRVRLLSLSNNQHLNQARRAMLSQVLQ